MIFHPASHLRQHTPWLMAIVALMISAAFARSAHAQADAPSNRAVASVEAPVLTAAEIAPATDAAIHASTDALAAPAAQGLPEQPPRKVRHIDIGSATQDLLAMQRASPGVRPRPIDGEQASRSYQRYLKSFETTIPEHHSTGLDLKKQ